MKNFASMSPDDILKYIDQKLEEKTIMTPSDLSTGGLLNAEQSNKFIWDTLQDVVVSKEARLEIMNSPKKDIDKIGFASRIMRAPGSEGTEESTTTKPTPEQVELSTVRIIGCVDISYMTLEDNIERADFADSLMTMIAAKCGEDLEDLYLNGDDGSGDPYYVLNDGWLILGAVAHGTNGNGQADFVSTADKTILNLDAMIDALPSKYLKNKAQWRFYVHPDLDNLLRRWVASRETIAGDRYMLEDVPMFYTGVPIIRVPMIVSSTAGTPSLVRSKIMLVKPDNLVLGIQRQIRIEKEAKPRKQQVEFTVTIRSDVQIEENDAVVVGTGMPHVLGSA